MRDVVAKNAAGIGKLPERFLKDNANVVSKLVTDICNLSISLNKFSSAFKLAKITPVFIKGQKANASNYRPLLWKVIEKVV